MSQYVCVICQKIISNETIEKRHYSPSKPMPPINKMVCSRKCSDALRDREGQYKDMSDAGKDARSKAVADSNRKQPRRKKKNAPIFA